jgi:hypothetical protein
MSQFNIPEDQQTEILNDRLNALNMDGFQQELNLLVASALGDSEQITGIEQNIQFISTAISAIQNRLDGIVPDPIVEPVSDPEVETE